jgi:hypothetical protein
MKKKGHHAIPDFSTKRAGPPAASDAPLPKAKPAPPVANQGIKPRATSKKSGHRGA